MESWDEIFRTIGFPAGLCLLLLWGIYKVAVPVAKRHVQSIDHTDATTTENVETLKTIRDSLVVIRDAMVAHNIALIEIKDALLKITESINAKKT